MSRNSRAMTIFGVAAFLLLATGLVALAVSDDSGARWIYLACAAGGVVAAYSVFASRRR
jgi:sulfite exporter TauE/SafE